MRRRHIHMHRHGILLRSKVGGIYSPSNHQIRSRQTRNPTQRHLPSRSKQPASNKVQPASNQMRPGRRGRTMRSTNGLRHRPGNGPAEPLPHKSRPNQRTPFRLETPEERSATFIQEPSDLANRGHCETMQPFRPQRTQPTNRGNPVLPPERNPFRRRQSHGQLGGRSFYLIPQAPRFSARPFPPGR